jgi:hypothetical protein
LFSTNRIGRRLSSWQTRRPNSRPPVCRPGWLGPGRAGDAIVDLGSPLSVAGSGDSAIARFSILQADSAEALQSVLAGHPHTAQRGTIEVLEFLPLPGM